MSTTPRTDEKIQDTFNGDNEHLRSCIKALIQLNDDGCLVPHGIGGHARALLASSYHRIAHLERELEEALVKAREALNRSSGAIPSTATQVHESRQEALTAINVALGGGNLEAESKGLPEAHPDRLADQRGSDGDCSNSA